MERVRIEKKLNELQIKKGILNINNIKDLEAMAREDENLKPMYFSMEKKSNKDTFSNYQYDFNNFQRHCRLF
jgi:hypothetical protein